MTDRLKLTDEELIYAATQRCRCGAGMAYPFNFDLSMQIGAWVCSLVLKGEGLAHDQSLSAFDRSIPRPGEHDSLPWAFFKVREETSINNQGGFTTRPLGTFARTLGKAECPKCGHKWQSEPYDACGLGHHWQSGPCPGCGYAVGSASTWSSSEGEPIKKRYPDVIIAADGRVIEEILP